MKIYVALLFVSVCVIASALAVEKRKAMPPPHGIAEIMKKRRLGMMKPGVAEAMENERTRISNHMAEIARRKREKALMNKEEGKDFKRSLSPRSIFHSKVEKLMEARGRKLNNP